MARKGRQPSQNTETGQKRIRNTVEYNFLICLDTRVCLFDTSSVGLIRHFWGRRFRFENFVGLMLLDDSIRSCFLLFLEFFVGENVLIFEVLFVIKIHIIIYQNMGNYVPL